MIHSQNHFCPIHHFTDYTRFDLLIITPRIKTIQINKSVDLKVDMIESGDEEVVALVDELLAPLKIHRASPKVTWAVNGTEGGNTAFGTVSGISLLTSYKAPSKAPKTQNPVAVSAQVDVNATYDGVKFGKTLVWTNIKVIEDAKFELEITVNEPYQVMTYTDHVVMQVMIKADGTVVISNIENFAPENNPESYTDGGCTLSMMPDITGEINIVTATGTATGSDPILNLYFTHQGTTFPSYKTDCGGGDIETIPGYNIMGIPLSLTFTLDDNIDVYDNNEGTHVMTRLRRSND